ncbi:hypothetical protein [Haloarcula sp. CGMCC 1.6347]|uniref:hypothetical protein n=1 Tax=Haloarcula sp. CGMCC 1.6347 TaxID=3111455 RepID=UPI00300EFFD5
MSNLSTSLPSVTGYDSVGDAEPADKEAGTTWYDTSVPTGKVYTGSQWVEESAPAGGSGITLSGGQYDVATSDGLTISSGAVALLLSGDLTIDGNGDLALSFDPVTQSELDNHSGDSTAHHSRYSDSEARTAVDGANVDIAGDADTVDGQDAGEFIQGTGSDESGNYAGDTWLQNSTGGVVSNMVSIDASNTNTLKIKDSGGTTYDLESGTAIRRTFILPPDWEWKFTGSDDGALSTWVQIK